MKTSGLNRDLFWVQVAGSIMGLFFFMICVLILYSEIMKDKIITTTTSPPNTSTRIPSYYLYLIMIGLCFLYIIASIPICMYYNRPTMMQTFRKWKYYSIFQQTCGRKLMIIKLWFLISTLAAYFLFPIAKQKKELSWFLLLLFTFLPLFLLISIVCGVLLILPVKTIGI